MHMVMDLTYIQIWVVSAVTKHMYCKIMALGASCVYDTTIKGSHNYYGILSYCIYSPSIVQESGKFPLKWLVSTSIWNKMKIKFNQYSLILAFDLNNLLHWMQTQFTILSKKSNFMYSESSNFLKTNNYYS